MGGALLEKVPKEGEGLKILGSAMVAWASSKEEVVEVLKRDVYAANEVWDFEKVSYETPLGASALDGMRANGDGGEDTDLSFQVCVQEGVALRSKKEDERLRGRLEWVE